jgi:flagellar basal-body rod protein FlgB
MIDWMNSNSMQMLQSSMRYLWTNQAVLLDNITNADTPNYKVKYVTFEDTFKAKIEAAASQARLQRGAMRRAVSFDEPEIKVAEDQTYRMDDNGVDVAEQQMELYRNTVQSQYVLDSINNNFSILRSAIRG